jgi:hypothetical protein
VTSFRQHQQAAAGAARSTRLRMQCPHCNHFARIRSSKALTPTYIELRFECTDAACGHIWLAGMEVLRTLCPSSQPNPDVSIPLAAAG